MPDDFSVWSLHDKCSYLCARRHLLRLDGGLASWTILTDVGRQIVTELNQEQRGYYLAYAINILKLEELIKNN